MSASSAGTLKKKLEEENADEELIMASRISTRCWVSNFGGNRNKKERLPIRNPCQTDQPPELTILERKKERPADLVIRRNRRIERFRIS